MIADDSWLVERVLRIDDKPMETTTFSEPPNVWIVSWLLHRLSHRGFPVVGDTQLGSTTTTYNSTSS